MSSVWERELLMEERVNDNGSARFASAYGWLGKWKLWVAEESHAHHIKVGEFQGVYAPLDDGVFGPVFTAKAVDEKGETLGHGWVQWRQDGAI